MAPSARLSRSAAPARHALAGIVPPSMDGVIHTLLAEHRVSVVGHVPDAGHTALIQRCEQDASMHVVTLTTEEEGIGLAAGAWLGGARSAILMQSSGVGNCLQSARPAGGSCTARWCCS